MLCKESRLRSTDWQPSKAGITWLAPLRIAKDSLDAPKLPDTSRCDHDVGAGLERQPESDVEGEARSRCEGDVDGTA